MSCARRRKATMPKAKDKVMAAVLFIRFLLSGARNAIKKATESQGKLSFPVEILRLRENADLADMAERSPTALLAQENLPTPRVSVSAIRSGFRLSFLYILLLYKVLYNDFIGWSPKKLVTPTKKVGDPHQKSW